MPELPDVEVYLNALRERVLNQPLTRMQLNSPFVLRTVTPAPKELEGHTVCELRRLGKRLVFGFAGDLYLVIHLMIAGRLQWKPPEHVAARKSSLAAFYFPTGVLLLTEAGTKRRASLSVVRGETALRGLAHAGIEPLEADSDAFRHALHRENHTLKRSLTDPRLLSGIGNAFSDEILHRARLSPLMLSQRLSNEQCDRLREATQSVLREWTALLEAQRSGGFPAKVTAFRPEMAVHGRFGQPCPDCGTPIQRIAYAENETNYCPQCQTGGRLLADRSLSRLLRSDWPRSLEEMEELRAEHTAHISGITPDDQN